MNNNGNSKEIIIIIKNALEKRVHLWNILFESYSNRKPSIKLLWWGHYYSWWEVTCILIIVTVING